MVKKTCLLRVDLNIEPNQEKNSFRLEAIIPTVKFLLKKDVKVVILSHRGRHSKLTLRPFASLISKKIKQPVVFIPHFNFPKIKKQIINSRKNVFLLENLRWLPGEEKNDLKLAKKLAALGDFYMNDAFAVSHRKNASVAAITKFLPSSAGLRLKEETKNLNRVMKNYRHPFTIIIGGAKVSDKIGVIKNFWRKADYFLLGGGPANTFFAAQGLPVGDSLIDKNYELLIKNYVNTKKIVLPSDVRIKNRQILDIGEGTIHLYSTIIRKSRTVIWNGPVGLFEKKEFERGTAGIWKAVLQNKKAHIVVGGGETTASLRQITNYESQITKRKNIFISTGGGAMLEYLSGKKLPGINAL